MVSEKMVAWGSRGCVIRDLAAYGEQRAAVVGAENVFNFTIGNPSVPAPSCVRQTIEHLLQTVPAEQLHAYTAAPGLASVRAKMAAYLEKTFGVGYRAEDVYMTSGASSALAMLAYALLSPGDEVLTLSPYFSEYKLYAEAAGGTLTAVPSNPEDFQIDLDAFSAAISEKTAVVLLNSPNNPSGVILSRRSITKLAELLEKKSAEYGHRIYIVADEPYRELAYDGEEVPFIPAIYKDTIYCYSFSKTLSLPGERIGFLAIHPELTDYARVRAAIYGAGRALGYINASTMFQLVAAECVGQTADISVYKQNRDLIHTALLDMGYTCVKPSGAFYLFLKTPEPDATAFCKKAMALDLLVVPGDEFGCPGYVRLAYCVPKTMLERSLPRFRRSLRSVLSCLFLLSGSYQSVNYLYLIICNQINRFRHDHPFCLFHNSPLQNLRGISLFHLHRFLQNDRAGIRSLIHKMHSSSGYFYASFQHTLMNFQSIIAGSAKRWDQRRMNVDDSIRISFYHDLRNHNQTSCQYHQIYTIGLNSRQKSLVKCLSRLILFW